MLFTSDEQFFYINFEKWNKRFHQDLKINSFDLTGRTQYKNMNTKSRSGQANFVNTFTEFMEYVERTDKENHKQNYDLIMNYLYSAKVILDKSIGDFLKSEKTSEDYEKYEEDLYGVIENLLVVKNSAGIYLRSTIVKLLRDMINEKYSKYGDNLGAQNVMEAKITNPELYVGDELMIDLYVFGYIQRLMIPFVSHWMNIFKEDRDKNESDDPLNTVLVRIWTRVLSLSFSKANRERIENKIIKKISATVTLREMRNPQFFRLWSLQGFDKNNMTLIAYEDFMFRSLFKIILSDSEKSKGLGFIDGVISNRVNLIFGDKIKEGESVQTLLENRSSNPDNLRRVENETLSQQEEMSYLDRGLDEFIADDKIESLFRNDDGIYNALRERTIHQVLFSDGPMSLLRRLDLSKDDILKEEGLNFNKTVLHTYMMNIILGSVMDLSLLQAGIKSKEYIRAMIYIYSYLEKNNYDSLLTVLKNSDLSEVTKYVSSSKTESLSMNIKESQLHNILKQIYSSQLLFSDKDRIFDYVIRICSSVGENQLKIYFTDVDDKVTEERINLLDLAKDLMRLIISFSR